MTERTSREEAELVATTFLSSWGFDSKVAKLAHDYLALLDENERLREAAARCGMSARGTLVSLAMPGGAGMTTNTPDATRLSDDFGMNQIPPHPSTYVGKSNLSFALWRGDIERYINWQTARIRDLEAQNRQYREALEYYADEDNYRGAADNPEFHVFAGECARAALNGDTDDTD